MKIPKWKHVLSYLFDFHLYNISSKVNGSMQLFYSHGEFKLTTLNVIYSWGKNYKSFGKAIEDLDLLKDESIESVLILGWGMGSIASLLEGHPTVKVVVGVDHDGALNKFYEQEFKENLPFEIKLYTDDALNFVVNDKLKYDLICSDIFVDNITPPKIISPTYLSSLNNLLRPNGKVLLSKLNRTPIDRTQNLVLEQNLKDLKIEFKSIKSFGNSVYWWRKNLE